MADLDAFKDPRQYFYDPYTLARARQQEAVEGAFAFVESRGLHHSGPADVLSEALAVLVPLRHAAWASNQNNVLIAGYGVGTTFTQPCLYQGMDALAIAQYISRSPAHPCRSEEHTSELQSLMRISYADFCLKKNKQETVVEKYNIATIQS